MTEAVLPAGAHSLAMGSHPQDTDDYTQLVDQNGLSKLFANRVRARIIVTLFYADEPLSPARIAAGAGISQSATLEALDPLSRFDIFETETHEADEHARYALVADDELVEAVRTVAELATDRYYPE